MKRIVSAVLVLMLCLGLAGCGEKTYTNDDLAIYDTQTEQLIRLGDSKENVEKILGKAKSEKDYELFVSCEYNDGMDVTYDTENKVKEIQIVDFSHDDPYRYKLPSGVRFGATVTDFQQNYPEAVDTQGSIEDYVTVLFVKKSGDKYKPCYNDIEEIKEESDFSDIYYILIQYDDYEKFDILRIGKGALVF